MNRSSQWLSLVLVASVFACAAPTSEAVGEAAENDEGVLSEDFLAEGREDAVVRVSAMTAELPAAGDKEASGKEDDKAAALKRSLGDGDWVYAFDVVEADGAVVRLASSHTETLRRPASTLKLFGSYAAYRAGAAPSGYIGDTLRRSVNPKANKITCLVGAKVGKYEASCDEESSAGTELPSFSSGMHMKQAIAAERSFLTRAKDQGGLGVTINGGSTIVDGSGLSYSNRITVSDLMSLLHTIHKDPSASQFRELMANPDKNGTLAGRFSALRNPGHVYGKTGTLGSVKALAGFIDLGARRTLVFSVIGERLDDTRAAFVRIERTVVRAGRIAEPNL
jgi:D-Ala-D-Ala carboxypeptidase 3 (S13) family